MVESYQGYWSYMCHLEFIGSTTASTWSQGRRKTSFTCKCKSIVAVCKAPSSKTEVSLGKPTPAFYCGRRRARAELFKVIAVYCTANKVRHMTVPWLMINGWLCTNLHEWKSVWCAWNKVGREGEATGRRYWAAECNQWGGGEHGWLRPDGVEGEAGVYKVPCQRKSTLLGNRSIRCGFLLRGDG